MMKLLAAAAGVLAAGSVLAGPVDDAAAGRTALNRGDNEAAIRLLTEALRTDGLDPGERELALVKRADAELGLNQASRAIADADAALAIDKADSEAADVKARAQASIAGQGQNGPAGASAAALNGEVKHFNDDIAARNAAKEASYQAGLAEFNSRIQSDADAYARAQAAYQAEVRNLDASHEADMAAWRAKAMACQRGDLSQCVKPSK